MVHLLDLEDGPITDVVWSIKMHSEFCVYRLAYVVNVLDKIVVTAIRGSSMLKA